MQHVPGVHAVHCVEMEQLLVMAVSVRAVADAVPDGQFIEMVFAPTEYDTVPGAVETVVQGGKSILGCLLLAHTSEPKSVLNWYDEHGKHVACPGFGWYEYGGHGGHTGWLKRSLAVPGGQGKERKA